MTSDTSTTNSSSRSSDERRKRKQRKKHKKEKKHKKQKKTKLQKEEKIEESKTKRFPNISTIENDDDAFGPALPPHLLHKSNELDYKNAESTKITLETTIIGPVLPCVSVDNQPNEQDVHESDEDESTYGPVPIGSAILNNTEIEREKRALELKIAAIEGRAFGSSTTDQNVREEWMMELPEVGLRSGLAALSNMKRTFYAGKEKPDFSDRSSWTKTPQSNNEQKPTSSKTSVESLRSQAEILYERQRDIEQERMAKKHKKKHKRDDSLLDLHQKKLKKERKQKEKELAALGAKPERRPFSREVDLKLNIIDKDQTKKIVDKAKILDSKFSSGKAKYL